MISGNITLWNPDADTNFQVPGGHTLFVRAVAFSPDGTRIISGSYDGTIRIWGIPSDE